MKFPNTAIRKYAMTYANISYTNIEQDYDRIEAVGGHIMWVHVISGNVFTDYVFNKSLDLWDEIGGSFDDVLAHTHSRYN